MSDQHSGDGGGSSAGSELVDHLKGLGLTSLAKVVPGVLDSARQQQWSYEAFLAQALGVERQGRAVRAYERRLRAAHLPANKSLESFDFSYQPSLSERLCRELAGLSFVATATNIVLLGPPGVGKTHLALAFLAQALETGYSGRFTTLRQLADELETVTWRQQRRRYLTPRVLVIDEVGYVRLTASQAQQLFDLVTARYERGAIILTTNVVFSEWDRIFKDPMTTMAAIDRVVHHSVILDLMAVESYRAQEAKEAHEQHSDLPTAAEEGIVATGKSN